MTALPPEVTADLERRVAELEKKLQSALGERNDAMAREAAMGAENARLFNETREALERQTATADILKVIASSPSDVQPVFEAIAASANRLIGGFSTAVLRFVDGVAHLAAFTPTSPAADAALQASFPRALSALPWGEQTRNGEIVHVPDTEVDPAVPPNLRDLARLPRHAPCAATTRPGAHRSDHRHAGAAGYVCRASRPAAPDFCRPGRHRHREYAAVQ